MTAQVSSEQRGAVSRIWNDKESRSVLIQVFTISALFALFVYLGYNAYVNLHAIGKDLSFEFLSQPASYDINQTLIDYNSRSTHFRAMIVGLLNTLLVAVCGILLATLLGFFVGVLRLSKNWLVNRIAYCYVEGMRNVPLLLWILLIHGVVVSSLPGTRDALNMGDIFFFSNRGLYSPSPSFEPLFWLTALAFVGGIGFSIWFKRRARKIQEETGRILPVLWTSLGAIIGLPIVVFLITGLPITWSIPELKGFNFAGGFAIKPEFLALWLALSFYTSAFIAEIVRAGILAVSYGQTEAAGALGLRTNRTLQLIIIPQALRVIVPPLTSQYLNLTKNSSLAIAIGYMDVVATIGGISLNQTGREMECMSLVLLIYLSFSLTISLFMNWYNKRIKLVER
jgi:general L-amino acid transport system permease protein